MDANLEHAMQTAVGVALEHPDQISKILSSCRIEDFTSPFLQILEAVEGVRSAKAEISALSVGDEMTRRGTIGRIGGRATIHGIAQYGFGDADYACAIIARHSKLRRLEALATQTKYDIDKPDADPLLIAQAAADQAQGIIEHIESEGDITTPTLGEFLDQPDPPYDWVIPGLMERGDRMILTGSEGLGKSVLQRQIAVCAAAGVHPFTHERIKPQVVLYVDCENGPVKLRRALRPLVIAGKQHGTDPRDRMWLEAIPAGLDLTKPEDQTWLLRLVSAIQPALLFIGPIYRLHEANPNDEEPARKITRVLDRCRSAANCALITEGHAGHAYGNTERPIRPTGSSLWLRWPEFGYGIRAGDNFDKNDRHVDVVPWRGDREQRDWPTRLKSGRQWPWESDETPWSPSQSLGANA